MQEYVFQLTSNLFLTYRYTIVMFCNLNIYCSIWMSIFKCKTKYFMLEVNFIILKGGYVCFNLSYTNL